MILNFLLFFNFLLMTPEPQADSIPNSIYDFKVEGLEGGTIDFSKFKGKKIMIVNTASECGYTPQYAELEIIYKAYKDKLVIVGFPSNDFGGQEPGSNKDIAAFCERNYGVTFPMASKVVIKGDGNAPIYKWLTNKEHNHYMNSEVKWNFQKYLIDENGELVAIFYSKTTPGNREIIDVIEK